MLSSTVLLPARHRAPQLTRQESDHVASGLDNLVNIDHKRPPAVVSLNSRTLVTCENAHEMMTASHEYIELSNDKDYEPKGTFLGMPLGTLTTRDITVDCNFRRKIFAMKVVRFLMKVVFYRNYEKVWVIGEASSRLVSIFDLLKTVLRTSTRLLTGSEMKHPDVS